MSISTLELLDVELSTDEGQYAWASTCTLAHFEDLSGFPLNKQFTLSFAGEPYAMIVDSRSLDRSDPANPVARVYGVSPIVNFQFPRAQKITKTWDTALNASEIVQELVPGLVWEILDWLVPAGVFGVQASSPLDAALKLVQAAGGLIESLPDGSIHARYRHVTTVPAYGPATKAFTLDDQVDNFSYSEKYQPNKVVNLIVIADQQTGSQNDRVEYIADEGGTGEAGVIRVYPAAWRDTCKLHATGAVNGITYLGISTRTEADEQVEFVAGAANLRYPVVAITGTVWGDDNLGTVTFDDYATPVRAGGATGYSMAKITYQTKCHEFRVVGIKDTEIQFVVEDV